MIKIFKNKKILITGGTGLIGRALVEYFIKISFEKNLNIKIFSISKKKLSIPKISGSIVKYVYLDITETNFENLPNFDYILHCAGYGQPKKFVADPISTIKINTEVLIKLSNKLKKSGTIIFMSTSEVYSGNKKKFPDEKDIGLSDPSHNRACYIEGKKCGETIINSLRMKGINAKSIRVSLVYGPGTKLDDNRVLNEFIVAAVIKNKITLLDEGSDIRHYIFIDDAIKMIIKIMLYGKEEVYNLGGKEKVSILNLAKKIATITNSQVIIPKYTKKRKVKGAPSSVGVNIKRYENEFGSIKLKSLIYGLKKNIKWYKSLIKQ